jgi:integrase
MAYRRTGRPTFYFEARTETGRKQLSTGTPSRALARRIEETWEQIAVSHRAWDLLGEVLAGRLAIGRLYDLWSETRGALDEVRRRLHDVDLDAIVDEWNALHARSVKSDSAKHALAHVRGLIPRGTRTPSSAMTTERLAAKLSKYESRRNTLRKVHSSWSVFFDYCTRLRGLYATSPMRDVPRPKQEKSPIRFYELDDVERIIDWQPTAQRRALFALLYGTGVEISVALGLTRADLNPATREVRAPGTKTSTRDRIARVADWAWPALWELAQPMLPATPLFPDKWDRWTASDWHRQTVGEGVKDTHGRVVHDGLKLRERLPMKNARHHWAVRRLRSGSPIHDVQRQLGHESPKLTLDVYGAFVPTGADRDHAEKRATEYEERRRAAK